MSATGAQMILQALLRCRKETRARTTDTETLDVSVMVERMARYETRKVLKALDEWPTRSEWWPTTRELIVLMDELFVQAVPQLGPPEYRNEASVVVDEARILGTPIGQLALRNEVGNSLIEWCRKNPNAHPDKALISRLAHEKVENDALAADMRFDPKKYLMPTVGLGLRDAMAQREADLRAKYQRTTQEKAA